MENKQQTPFVIWSRQLDKALYSETVKLQNENIQILIEWLQNRKEAINDKPDSFIPKSYERSSK